MREEADRTRVKFYKNREHQLFIEKGEIENPNIVWGKDDPGSETRVELEPLPTYSDDEAETGLGKVAEATTKPGRYTQKLYC